MAAIDPSAPVNPEAEAGAIPRATLKMIREPIQGPGDDEDDSEDEDDEDYMRALLAESDSEDDEAGASDKKSKKAAALKELMESIGQGEDESDEDMEEPRFRRWKGKMQVDTEQLRNDAKSGGTDSLSNEEKSVPESAASESGNGSSQMQSRTPVKSEEVQPSPSSRLPQRADGERPKVEIQQQQTPQSQSGTKPQIRRPMRHQVENRGVDSNSEEQQADDSEVKEAQPMRPRRRNSAGE